MYIVGQSKGKFTVPGENAGDERLLSEAVHRGLIQPEDREEALKRQLALAAKGIHVGIADILVMEGRVTRAQITMLLPPAAPPRGFAGYLIWEKIGQGATAVVYRASRTDKPDRMLALKILHDRLVQAPRPRARFIREAEHLVRIRHPNIVEGYEHGEFEGRPYIEMELLLGARLSDIVEEVGPLDESPALKVALDVSRGLELIDTLGLVHRDIKPENIFVVSATGAAKLMDLGLTKESAAGSGVVSDVTGPQRAVGTPEYMPPEQFHGSEALDSRADLYALGVTLFVVLTGRVPFPPKDAYAMLRMKVAEPVPDVRRMAGGRAISAATAQLILALMAADRAHRPPGPKEVSSRISSILGGE